MKYPHYIIRLFFGFVLLQFQVKAQKPITYSAELGTYLSTNNEIPFWQRTNTFGIVPNNPNTLLFRQNFSNKKDSLAKKYVPKFGIELVTVVGRQSKILLPEAYIQQKIGPFQLLVGRKKQVHGLVDTTLSSGSLTWSGNALPLPEIQFGIQDYQKLFVKWLGFKGHISHGWFGKQTYVDNYYLHRKTLYIRAGTSQSKVKLYTGVIHNAQWGGKPTYDLGNDSYGRLTNGRFPSDWFTFKQVFYPKNALSDTTLGYGNFEIENRFGSHLGQIDFGAELKLKRSNLLIYRQIPVETGRTIGSLSNLDDGLYGICVSNPKKGKFFEKGVFEVLYTLNQHSYNGLIARLFNRPLKDYSNNAFLFNHQQYYDGWSYESKTLGTPFLIPQKEIRTQKKIGNDFIFVNNNRVVAFFWGYEGTLNQVKLQVKSSFSKNFGALDLPIIPSKQFSHAIAVDFPLPKIKGNLKFNIAIDQGDLIYDNYGAYISYCRTW